MVQQNNNQIMVGMLSLEQERLREKLAEMRQEHRDLDEAIAQMLASGKHDMLQLQRMKKRKLVLKDMIAKFESMLIDDIIA
jgi:hypothetical protein